LAAFTKQKRVFETLSQALDASHDVDFAILVSRRNVALNTFLQLPVLGRHQRQLLEGGALGSIL
jgi:hypothetical protein